MDMLCILKVDDKDIKYSKGLQVRNMPVGSKTVRHDWKKRTTGAGLVNQSP